MGNLDYVPTPAEKAVLRALHREGSIAALLKVNAGLQALTLFQELKRRAPGHPKPDGRFSL